MIVSHVERRQKSEKRKRGEFFCSLVFFFLPLQGWIISPLFFLLIRLLESLEQV